MRARGFAPTGHNEADALALPFWASEMKIPTSPYLCPLGPMQPEPLDRSRVKRQGRQRSASSSSPRIDRRLDITERRFIRRLGERHYGAKENRHGCVAVDGRALCGIGRDRPLPPARAGARLLQPSAGSPGPTVGDMGRI
jgi:hypothetical protein